ncbi:MAG: Stp1/IreP family PP2C-type Ser/Thr phosphatase [Firmicutes bacterium]|nr:Stp1/IreP family PP2C-type Ser/Thr phosphatase [Bacillota bacterium]
MLPSFFAVADGMGGHEAGEVASSVVIQTLEHFPYDGHNPGDSLRHAVETANQKIYALAESNEQYRGMGTTVTAAKVLEDRIYIVHVGDSRAYHISDGAIQQVTADHSVVGELKRSGSITEDEAMIHPQRNLLTRAVGTDPQVEVDLVEFRVQLDDVLVLCTDGLTGQVTAEEIREVVERCVHPQAAADALVRMANERGGPDNISVIVVYMLPPQEGLEKIFEDTAHVEDLTALDEMICAPAVTLEPVGAAKQPSRPRIRSIYLLLGALLLVGLVAGISFSLYLNNVYFIALNDGRVSVFQGLPLGFGPFKFYRLAASTDFTEEDVIPRYRESLRRGVIVENRNDAEKQILDLLSRTKKLGR